MTQILRQSTAVDVLIGPFVDSGDGYTAEEALSPSVLLSKNGQALAAKNDVTTPTHDDAGYYNCELDATDTNTVGTLILIVEGSATHLPVRHEFMVVEENVYDMVYASGGDLGTTVDAILTDTGTTLQAELDGIQADTEDIQSRLPAALVGGRIDATVDATGMEAGAVSAIQSGLATAAALATVDGNVDSILEDTGTTLPSTLADILTDTGTTLPGILGTPAGADLAADIAAVLSAVQGLNDLSAGDVATEIADALGTDTYAEPSGVPAATAALATKIGFIYLMLRNQVTVTASKKTFYDDAGNAEFEKDLSDDGTTYTETEVNAI